MDNSTKRPLWLSLLIALFIFLLYVVAAKLGLSLAFVNASASAIWAPTGIALAVILIFGDQFWPCIFGGAFLVNYLTAGSLITSLVIAGGNTLEALLGALLVHKFANGKKAFERASDIIKFSIFAETISTTISPTFGVTSLCIEGYASWSKYSEIWTTWWLGDFTGALIVTPVLLLWYEYPRVSLRRIPFLFVAFLLVDLIGQAVFGNWILPTSQNMPLEFLCIPPLIWTAFRFGLRDTATASFLLACIAIADTLHGSGPFVRLSPNQSLLLLQIFMSVISITVLALAAAIAERKTAEENLERAQKAEKNLREKIELIQLLQSITVATNEALTLPEAVQLSLMLICRYMGWPVGHVYYVERAKDELLLKSGAQWFIRDEQKYKKFRQATQNTVFKPSEGLIGTVFSSGIPEWIEDVSHFKNFPRAHMGFDIKVRAAFGFPVMIGKNVVAVLEFFSDRPTPPDQELMESMKHVGTQLGRIIERHNAEQTQSQLALLVETSSDFIVTANPEGYILYLNEAGRAMVGLDKDFNVSVLRHEDFVFGKDLPKLHDEVLASLINQDHWEGEFRLKNFKTGQPIPIYFSAGLLKNPQTGQPSTLAAIGHDITDIKKAEEALHNNEKHFRALIENALDIVTVLDPQSNFLFLSPSTETVLGYTPDELKGINAFSLIHPEDLDLVIEKFTALVKDASKTQSSQFRYKHKNGHWVHLEAIGKNLLTDPSVKGIVVNSRDISEKKEAEKEVENTNSFLSAILENIPNMIFVKDAKEFRFVMFNKAGEKLIGVPREDLIGKNDYDFFPKEQADFFTTYDKKVIASGKLLDIAEETIQTKDKGNRILHTKKIPVLNEDGSPRFLLGISEDITEQKRTEEERQRLVTLVEYSRDLIVWSSPEGKNLYINKAGQQMVGIDPDTDINSLEPELFFAPDEISGLKTMNDLQGETIRQRGFWEGEINIRHQKTGKYIPLHLSVVMLKNPKTGKPLGTATIGRDMTERRETEKTLRESDMRFRSVVQSSQSSIIIANRKGKILSWNAGAARTFGYSEQEMLGKSFTDIMPIKDRETYAIDETIFQTPQGATLLGNTVELRGMRKNGVEFPIEFSLSSWDIAGNTYFGGIIRDITERKKMEDLLRSNTELQQFANVASHDLQEPLRMVASYVQLLAEHCKDLLDEDAKEYMGFAVDGAKRMQMLVNGLLEYSRVESRGKPPELLDMNQIFNQTVSNLEILISETRAKISHGPLPHVMGDPVQLAQLVQNLFSNALKFQKTEPPIIHFSAQETEKEWVFSCKDNGIGIDPKYFDRIFVIFQRLHHRNEYTGTGIGLAICKRIIERHGGRIWVESEPNQGATFFFTLPKRKN